MSRLFKEIAFTARRPLSGIDKKIEYMSRVVCALFVRGMQKTKCDFWKLSIRFNFADQVDKNKVSVGVYEYYRDFPSDEFLSWKKEKQQNFLLDFVSCSVCEAFSLEGIDTTFIDSACEFVRRHNFLNLFEGRSTLSPFEGRRARIVCEQDILDARIYMEIYKGKCVERYFIARCEPDEFHIQMYFGHISWLEEKKLSLTMSGAEEIIIVRN